MARRIRTTTPKTGLYQAREARGLSRSDLVRLSGISKQQLSRLENGQIRLRLDHLKPFAPHLGYSPEQMLLWGKFPGTGGSDAEAGGELRARLDQKGPFGLPAHQVPEIDIHADPKLRKGVRHGDPLKGEKWQFPESFVHEQLHSAPKQLLVLEATGDSMAPTILAGERVIVDTVHTTPSPDGLYAIRDAFKSVIVKRLQVLRSSRPTGVKVISDNPTHPSEEVPLGELEIVGKVLCCLKLC
jgi:transcriptional regulator with XRE-family HTH domain